MNRLLNALSVSAVASESGKSPDDCTNPRAARRGKQRARRVASGTACRITAAWLLLPAVLFGALCASFPALSQAPPPNAPDAARIVQFLDRTITWYRQTDAQQQLVTGASDSVFVSGDRQMADEVVRLVFQFARAEAEAAPQLSGTAPGAGQPAGSAYASLMQQEAKAEQDVTQLQGEVADLRKKAAAVAGGRRQALETQLAATQSEAELALARVDAFRNMAQFMSGATTGATGLSAQIDALASTVPADLTGSSNAATNSAASGQQASPPAPAAAEGKGLWEAGENLFATFGKLRGIDGIIRQTQAVAQIAQDIRTPMVNQLRQLTQRADQLAQQAGAADAGTLAQEKEQLDALTQQFKQLTAAAIPIAKAGILLTLYQNNLSNWRASALSEVLAQVRSLLLRLLVVAVIVAAVVAASELWRRAIFRYVRDVRRRSQFHWMRKLAVWLAIGAVVAFSFVSQLGSVATFAGLLTAGIAVALQNVIQSVVGYFFLIGKYGIRAGDRVQIGGVNGEVIDVGLVRIHIMEMGGLAEDAPTGRVVEFSNSIVFQPTGLFKQIPGTSFAWHEITLTLPADADFSSVRERLMKAVETGLSEYKDEIARQHSAMENTLEVASATRLDPTVQLQFTSSGPEAKVRYPVALRHAMEIDERVARALLSDPDLSHAGAPAIRLKTSSAT